MPKIYRTMQGDQIDIEALFQKNELAIAVGNMQANARGDELGAGGAIVKTREQKAREYYLRQKARKAAEANPAARINDAPAEEPLVEQMVVEPPIEVKQDKPAKEKKSKVDLNGPVDTELGKTPDKLDDPDGTEGL